MHDFIQNIYIIIYLKGSQPLRNFFELSPAISGEKAHDTPYEVEITIPIDNYEPIQFSLTKMCGKYHTSLYFLPHTLV